VLVGCMFGLEPQTKLRKPTASRFTGTAQSKIRLFMRLSLLQSLM